MNFNLIPKSIAILLPAMFICSTTLFSQIKFEKGYFIDNDNKRTECLIKNMDWQNAPRSFDYKLTEEGKANTLTIKDAAEVVILGNAKYIRAMVKIDRSYDYSNDFDEISSTREPEWSTEELFLKVIVDGQAAILFAYHEKGLARFFYGAGNSTPEQLVYKAYKINATSYDYNRTYIDQLNENFSCTAVTGKTDQTRYKEADLKKYFIQYNSCKGQPVANTNVPAKRKSFSVSILSGFELASLQTEKFSQGSITRLDSKLTPVIGAEFEYTLPFNKNKLSVLLDVYRRNYSSTGKDTFGTAEIHYGSIQTVIGPRYHFFIAEDFQVFLSALVLVDFKTSSSYERKTNLYPGNYTLDIQTLAPLIGGGVGCAYKDFSAEFRYITQRELFPSYTDYGSAYKSMALIVRYRIFKF